MIESYEIKKVIPLIGVQFFSQKNTLSLPAAWKYFEEMVPHIPHQLKYYSESKSYAICQSFNRNDLKGFTYFIGIPVSSINELPNFAVAKIINIGNYDKLSVKQINEIDSALKVLSKGNNSELSIEVYYPDNSAIDLLMPST